MEKPIKQMLRFECGVCGKVCEITQKVELWDDPVIGPPPGWACAGTALPEGHPWSDEGVICDDYWGRKDYQK